MNAGRDKRDVALQLFDRLLDIDPAKHRGYLDEHCTDPGVRQRVEAMLHADDSQWHLLDSGADQHLADMTIDKPVKQPTPERIGPYRIVERLGEGGMATVYRAERAEQDFEQTVALKLILPSRQSEHWQTRFLQERQILATLQHRNIAVLLDGGITEDGQPFFAMEYVDGKPITTYCDSQRLDVRERIRLFCSVCEAVGYAHTNLIVHRDLKPSNILVDASGAPKLLDFGIAKILSDDDTSRTQTTLRALTPDYAAPEQFAGGPVTTAVDVFALGGLLFELLAGRRPFVSDSGSALDIERKIRKQGAPGFSSLAQTLAADQRDAIANARRTSWRRLQRTIHGDLENIVLKALRVEPERRYASVEAMRADLVRYLEGLPVSARSDTLSYRMRKFVGRHPVGVPLGAIAAVGLIVSSAFALQQAREAELAAALARLEAAKANQTRDFVTSLFEFAGPDKSLGEQLTARQLLDLGASRVDQQLGGQPALHAEMLLLLARTYGQLAMYDKAVPLAKQAADIYASMSDDALQVDALIALARLNRLKGEYPEAMTFLDVAEGMLANAGDTARSELLVERGEVHREQAQFEPARQAFNEALNHDQTRLASAAEIARDLYRLGTLEFSTGDTDRGLDLLRQAAELLAESGAENTTAYASIQHDIGVMLRQYGDLAAAKASFEAARVLRTRLFGGEHPDLAVTYKELAGIAREQGDNEEAERLYLAAIAINEAMLGEEHPETANTLNSLAVFYRGLGDNERALQYAARALDISRQSLGDNHPTVGLMTVNIGSLQRMTGDLAVAERTITDGLEIITAALGEQHQLAGVALNALAGVLHDQGRTTEAEPLYTRALEIFDATAGPSHPHTVNILNGLATLKLDGGYPEEAETLFRRAVEVADVALPEDHPTTATVQAGLERAIAARRP
tara:strand:+ start:5996 stop:8746 length:2751 start_codon:yes stop_codon:yes gene_type:complete